MPDYLVRGELVEVNDVSSEVSHEKDIVVFGKDRTVRMRTSLTFRMFTVTLVSDKRMDRSRLVILQSAYEDRGTAVVCHHQELSCVIDRDMTWIVT